MSSHFALHAQPANAPHGITTKCNYDLFGRSGPSYAEGTEASWDCDDSSDEDATAVSS